MPLLSRLSASQDYDDDADELVAEEERDPDVSAFKGPGFRNPLMEVMNQRKACERFVESYSSPNSHGQQNATRSARPAVHTTQAERQARKDAYCELCPRSIGHPSGDPESDAKALRRLACTCMGQMPWFHCSTEREIIERNQHDECQKMVQQKLNDGYGNGIYTLSNTCCLQVSGKHNKAGHPPCIKFFAPFGCCSAHCFKAKDGERNWAAGADQH